MSLSFSFLAASLYILEKLGSAKIIIEIDIKSTVFLASYYLLQFAHPHRFSTQRIASLLFFIGCVELNLFDGFLRLFLQILAVI